MSKRRFSFARYVAEREGREEAFCPSDYAYGADLSMLRAFKRMPTVEAAARKAVRGYKHLLKNQYLGTTVRVGPRQLPRIHGIAERCADRLSVDIPTVYVANNPFLNAFTFGTEDDAFIVVHSALIDHFTAEELTFALGHETGHVHNQHVVYGTVLQLMKTSASILFQWLLPPAELALATWARRAEITCDRAGLLCAQDLEVGTRTLVKLASGAQSLYDELDIDVYMEQLAEGSDGIGRLTEAFASHPYLPKRVEALRIFAQSALYRRSAGLGEDGLSMQEVDRRTDEVMQIVRRRA